MGKGDTTVASPSNRTLTATEKCTVSLVWLFKNWDTFRPKDLQNSDLQLIGCRMTEPNLKYQAYHPERQVLFNVNVNGKKFPSQANFFSLIRITPMYFPQSKLEPFR